MTAAPVAARAFVSSGSARRAIAFAFARIAVVSAILGAIAASPPEAPRLYRSFAFAHQVFASGTLPLRFGPETAASGAESGALGWLEALATTLLYDGPLHYGALACASALAALLAFALVERRARTVSSPALALAATALAALCSIDALHVGGATSTLAFAAAAALLLETPTAAGALTFAALTVLWCNVEPAGLLAFAFALVSALGRSLEDIRSQTTRYAWLTAAASLIATLATPALLQYPRLAFVALNLGGALNDAAPWKPDEVAPHAYHIGVMLLIFAALALGLRGRGARDALLAAFAFVVALANGALVPVAGIIAAPILAGAAMRLRVLAQRPHSASDGGRSAKATASLFLTGVLIALTFGFAIGVRQPRLELRGVAPYVSVERLAHARSIRRLFCTNVGWCDAAVADGLAVVADSRVGLAPKRIRDAQITIASVRKGWRERLNILRVDGVVTGSDSALATLLIATGWRRFAPESDITIFVRGRDRTGR